MSADAGPPADSLRVFVRGLTLQAEIGLYPHERDEPQPLVVDIELDLAPAAVRRLADTVDYDTLAGLARDLAGRGHIELVETFAQRLAAACLADPRAICCRVRVEKPRALADAAAAGVEVVLTRGG